MINYILTKILVWKPDDKKENNIFECVEHYLIFKLTA